MNNVHLVTQEKYRVEKKQVENQAGCTSTKLAQPVRTGRAPNDQVARAPRPCRAPAAPCRAPGRPPACPAPRLRLPTRPSAYPRALCAPRAPAATCPAALLAQPLAQLPSLCCIVTQAYPGSQYSLYCNTNLLPTKLYCNTVSSKASHLYCNTISPLTIQF